jgi:hypothetical protein
MSKHSRDLQARTDEIHRYFPEWADRKPRDGKPWEAQCNSYLAGGYAEEFGYRAPPGWPLALPQLEGEPELTVYWRAQIGALHPGYPECPRPSDRFDPEHSTEAIARDVRIQHIQRHDSAKTEAEFHVISVGLRGHARDRSAGGWILRWKELRIRQRAFRSVL